MFGFRFSVNSCLGSITKILDFELSSSVSKINALLPPAMVWGEGYQKGGRKLESISNYLCELNAARYVKKYIARKDYIHPVVANQKCTEM